ncbi:MAG TPA: TylF/MycF/NovP-related O-methyltransferase, partial [Saprospiraceae bacterium]|nr:TylF/MycF/NovP-related O-methyltransferase [Saprospiraceae bacterium]
MKHLFIKLFKSLGYTFNPIVKDIRQHYPDIKDKEFWDIHQLIRPYTMTSVERMYALYNSVNHVLVNNIKGDFVECGVWRGGSSMLIANMLANRNSLDRKIYLYDTFEGMSEPSQEDLDFSGRNAAAMMKETEDIKETSVWCLADLSDVTNNMKLTGFSMNNIVFVKGKVEDTIPQTMPDGDIALLRLDTDWYESTKHELIYLYPKLINNGILIIDDYG